jgi:site-specific DNA-methyltransferase (adenine-specific)
MFRQLIAEDGHLYIMTNHINMSKLLNELDNANFQVSKILTWVKDNKIMGQYYMSQSEFIVFARPKKGKARRINNCGTSDVIQVANKKTKDINGNNIHDTEKPVELMKTLVGNSIKGSTSKVLDPFMGVGSTGLACLELDCEFVGIELDENYFEIAKTRLESNE